jgi:succinyl-CoA synthetase beta subunit
LKDEFSDHFLIEEMKASPIAEMMIGIQNDHQFGYSLLLGSGGTQAEITRDTTSILLPTNKSAIIRSIKKLRLFSLMNGFRGNDIVDLEKLSSSILDITNLFDDNKECISSLEINPLFVYQNSNCAVDAVISSSED